MMKRTTLSSPLLVHTISRSHHSFAFYSPSIILTTLSHFVLPLSFSSFFRILLSLSRSLYSVRVVRSRSRILFVVVRCCSLLLHFVLSPSLSCILFMFSFLHFTHVLDLVLPHIVFSFLHFVLPLVLAFCSRSRSRILFSFSVLHFGPIYLSFLHFLMFYDICMCVVFVVP